MALPAVCLECSLFSETQIVFSSTGVMAISTASPQKGISGAQQPSVKYATSFVLDLQPGDLNGPFHVNLASSSCKLLSCTHLRG